MMTQDELFEAELERTIREQVAAENKIDKMFQDDTKLSESQANDVLKILEDNAQNSDEIKTIREITESEHTEVLENEEGVGKIVADSATGVNMVVPNEADTEVKERPISEKSLSELESEYEPTKIPVLDDELNKQFKDEMNLSDEDAAQLLNVIHRHSKGERFSKFNALPKSVQDIIKTAGAEVGITNPDALRFFTNSMLDEFIQDAAFNKEIVDFEESIKKELNIPSLVDMHSEYIKDAMEKDLQERANKLEEEGKTDKAEMLRKVSAAFTSSYTYDKLKETIATNRKVRSRLFKDIEKYKRFCDDFVYKYKDTQFNIHDIALCLPILQRKFPHRSLNELIMFVNCMWKSLENLDIKDIENNIYAYYLIKNIMSLDFVEDTAKTDFTDAIMTNIDDTIDIINDYVTAKAEYDSKIEQEKLAKKGGKKHV